MPTHAVAIRALARQADPNCPSFAANATLPQMETTWTTEALSGYAELLREHLVPDMRQLTWRLLTESARRVVWADNALAQQGKPDFVTALAVAGSAARGEASEESDADFNALLDPGALPADTPELASDGSHARRLCVTFAGRDVWVRDRIGFEDLITAMDTAGYPRLPRRKDGRSGERLRAFAESEMQGNSGVTLKSGIAGTAFSSTFPLDGAGSSTAAWNHVRDALGEFGSPGVLALAGACHAGKKRGVLVDSIPDPGRRGRHQMQGVVASVANTLYLLAADRPPHPIPYWGAPLWLVGYSIPIRRRLAMMAYLTAKARVERQPPDERLAAKILPFMRDVIAELQPGGSNPGLTPALAAAIETATRLGRGCGKCEGICL